MEIYSIVSIVIEAKERTRGEAGERNVIFFLLIALCAVHTILRPGVLMFAL